jgi:hypothetical protein
MAATGHKTGTVFARDNTTSQEEGKALVGENLGGNDTRRDTREERQPENPYCACSSGDRATDF